MKDRGASPFGLTPRVATLTAAVVISALIASWVQTLISKETSSHASAVSIRTVSYLQALDRLETGTVNVETSVRGYLISGKESFLQFYGAGRTAVLSSSAALPSWTGNDPALDAGDVALGRLADARLAAAANVLDATERGDRAAATALVASGAGQSLTDRIRTQVATLRARALANLDHQRKKAAAGQRNALIAFGTVGAALMLLLGGLVWMLIYYQFLYKARRQAQIDSAESLAEVRRLAVQDALTGLPNRRVFEDRLAHALQRTRRSQTSCAVYFCDIDRFKDINDTHGHAAGDAMLTTIAGMFNDLLRAEDTVSRLGGDEFALLVEDITSVEQASQLGERIAATLDRTYAIDGRELESSVSVGLAVANNAALHDPQRPGLPHHTVTPAQVIAAADLAMYDAKQAGGAQCRLWDSRAATDRDTRHRLTNDLRHTLNDLGDPGERLSSHLHHAKDREAPIGARFDVAYQPIVDLETGDVVGTEALARWTYPGRGAVSPEEFVAAAEASGLIHSLGRHVLRSACAQTRTWNHTRQQAGQTPLWVSVNCSPRQLHSTDVIQDVTSALAESGLPPQQLTLELTETALLQGAGPAITHLHMLHDLGITIALDDFGTGYSSLSYLRQLPINLIKIDRSFITGLGHAPADDAIVAAVTSLAGRLRQAVLAEGIETIEQQQRSAALGCQYGQGFLYDRPRLPTELDLTTATRGTPADLL